MENVEILMPQTILNTVHFVMKDVSKKFYRDGVELEKGAVITKQRIEKHRGLYEQIMNTWSVYPDLYLKMITPTTSKFKLKFFQIIFIRACLRHGRLLTIAPRAIGKSFICILALYLICIFRSGSHVRKALPYREVRQKRLVKRWELRELLNTTISKSSLMNVTKVETSFSNRPMVKA